MSAGPASLPAPCPQLWSSGAKPMPLLLLAGPRHAITIFCLTTLIASIIMACVATFMGKMSKMSNYEVSCQPAFPPASSPQGAHSSRTPSCLGHPQHQSNERPLPFSLTVGWADSPGCAYCVCPWTGPRIITPAKAEDSCPLLFPRLTSPPNHRLLAHPSYDVSLSSHRAAGTIPRDGGLRERME